MAGLVEGGGPEGTDDREETPPPLTKEHIKGHVSALKSLIKSDNQRNKADHIHLDFKLEDTEQTLDRSARRSFERLFHDSINEWADLGEAFAARYSVRRVCFKKPHEITKIVRNASESLTAFKERWTVETGFIMGISEVMKISSFMDSVKSPKLAKCFSNKVPTTVNEMMEMLDDFIRSEVTYASIELLKGETGEVHRKASLPFNRRDNRSFQNTHSGKSRRNDYRSSYRGRDSYLISRTRDDKASEHRDYHQEKGHYTNDFIQLRMQLEMALESRKLNHLVKNVRQRGRGSHGEDAPQPAMIINVISVNSVKDKKRK
nr:reverse transcriptase domain-containing protein [Tanacetum cinerariifolium]